MPPIILRFKENESFLPFSNLDQEELSKTWRVCTKVKDSLENGSRLENLSWRLWFIQNVLVSNDVKAKTRAIEKELITQPPIIQQEKSLLDYSLDEIKPVSTTTENFILNQFTSDQENDQTIELKDIFPFGMDDFMYDHVTMDPVSDNQLNQWNTGISPSLYTDVPSMIIPFDDQLLQQNAVIDYSSALTTIPNATLHNKLLATLPRETLQSAERLLTPIKRYTEPVKSKPKQPQHYFNTFQLDPNNNTLSNANKPHRKNNNVNYGASSSCSSPSADEIPPICSNCEATTTPLWRRSAEDKILCNACGLYLKLHNVPRPKKMKLSTGKNTVIDNVQKDNIVQTVCSNCATMKTPLWRRDDKGAPLCNACGLYLKLHNQKRPLSLKTDVIKKRQRTEVLLDDNSQPDNKKPRYYDQHSLNKEHGNISYRNSATSLPGTGILMMTTHTSQLDKKGQL